MPDLQTALINAIHSKPAQLHAIVNDWDKQEQEIRQPQQEKAMEATEAKQERGAVVKGVFAFIKANPGKYTGQETAVALGASHKLNPGSVLACISQFITAGQASRSEDGKLTMLMDEYETLNAAYAKALKNSPKHKRARALAALEKAREARAANIAKRKKAAERAERKAAKIAEVAANRGDYEAERAAAEKVQGIAALQPAPTPVLPNLPTAESVLNNMSIVEARKLYDELKKIFG